MSDSTFVLSHRQLVSAVISLLIGGDPLVQPLLGNLGYTLNALEVPMQDPQGRRFVPDLHAVKRSINLSLLIDCKCSPENLDEQQIGCYLTMEGSDVVRQGRLSIENARVHQVDAVFFALVSAEPAVALVLNRIISPGRPSAPGLGLVRVERHRIQISHDELSDPDLSRSLSDGWEIDVERLPLERLPYEPSSPNWELAQAVLQTLAVFFVEARASFDVEDICVSSNDLWPYLTEQQDLIRGRVRRMMRNLRGTAFKGWLLKAPGITQREEQWRFAKRSTVRANVQAAFSRRASRYVELLEQGRPPRPEDFADIDQLPLPITLPGGEAPGG